ncbi:MAG: rod shape-determining protein RodA [Balneolales bacterium]|nr:rod shape-determining protein RodA [Balneolales bacterium]
MTWYTKFDWLLFISWLGLSLIGLIAIYSATQGPMHQDTFIAGNFSRQVLHLVLGLIIIVIMLFISPRAYVQLALPGYLLCLFIALLTVFFGVEVGGERNWLNIAGFRLQISEFMKLGTILAIAAYLSNFRNATTSNFQTITVILVLILAPVGLITLHGDTGTSLVYIALIPFILFWVGLSYGYSLLLTVPALIAYFTIINIYVAAAISLLLVFAVFMLEKKPALTIGSVVVCILVVLGVQFMLTEVLQPHQRARVESFHDPSVDPHGAGWNVIQAKTAISSGGIHGKGFLQGTQTQLRFLPEQQTDFIFCVISEEFGLIGGGLTLFLFFLMISRLIAIAGSHKNSFAKVTIIGVASVFIIHIIVNLGMAMALLPVIGIPLPLISYGGSSFLSFSIMIGLCLNFDYYMRDFGLYS